MDGARRIVALVATAVVVVFGVAACGGPAPAVLSVAIDGGDPVTDVGGTRTLTATVVVQGGAATGVDWSTDDGSVATIDAAGVLAGVGVGTTTVRATSTVDATRQATATVRVQAAGDGAPLWTQQYGGAGEDGAAAVAIDPDGRIAVAGSTTATSGGPSNLRDGFLLVLTASGAGVWERELATTDIDDAEGVAATNDGQVVVVGSTRGGLEAPGANLGATDAYVRAYGATGVLAWTRQFGTVNGEVAYGVAAARDGAVAVAGQSTGAFDGTPSLGAGDVFVRRYLANGDLDWSVKLGSDPGTTGDGSDAGLAVAVGPDGRVAVAGRVRGTLAAPHAGNVDAFVRVYEADGDVAWTVQFGTSSDDVAQAVAVGSDGRVAVAGTTRQALDGAHAGSGDAFVRLYERDGTLAWARQFGTSSEDEAAAVAIDAAGNVVVAGGTEGALAGASAGGEDVFVRKYDPYGAERWTRQFGTGAADAAHGVAVDPPSGEIVVAGGTSGTLEGVSGGGRDVFVRRLEP